MLPLIATVPDTVSAVTVVVDPAPKLTEGIKVAPERSTMLPVDSPPASCPVTLRVPVVVVTVPDPDKLPMVSEYEPSASVPPVMVTLPVSGRMSLAPYCNVPPVMVVPPV